MAFHNLANREEIQAYAQAVEDFLNLKLDADRFTATRLQMGVYGQRQEGVHMVRIKIPGGRLHASQLNAIAELLEKYSKHGLVHITTRQDIQMHYVPTHDTPTVLRKLADAGLTTREACGNTIRNITACPMAGICPREHTDVTRHLDGAVNHFLRNPLNQQLPRKFKISLSGCEADCAQGMLHCMGIIAVKKGDRFGFKVLAGGGLGHKPHEAIVVEEFIEEKDLLHTMEAIVTLHNKYSDRTKRAKSRIKFLVDKFGPEGFIEKYREELARIKQALANQSYTKGVWKIGGDGEICGPGAPRHVVPQKQQGLALLPISVPIGHLNAKQLRGIAKALEAHRLDEIRTTQDQNLMVINVPEAELDSLRSAIAALGLREPDAGDNVVACPGTSTCRLGITSSTLLGPKLRNAVGGDLRIRVSGCHNGCAQPEMGDIGIYGEGKRMHGKLIPHYQTYFGGNGLAGGGLGFKGPSVPAVRIESAVRRVREAFQEDHLPEETFFYWTRRRGIQYFNELLADLVQVPETEVSSVLRDHGDNKDFKVLQLGGGECAGATQMLVGSNFFEAAHERSYRNALMFQRKYGDAVKCAEAIARLIGQGVIHLLGGNNKQENLANLGADLVGLLSDQPGLGKQLAEFGAAFARDSEGWTEKELKPLFAKLDSWTVEVAELCVSHDRQLDLTGALPALVGASKTKSALPQTAAA
ncbi:MAG TPA: nitrite/sulfite reductase [Burkholderiales bacterium]|nr:nitrite/sulfite reductase [Burkholderiales bacterium]